MFNGVRERSNYRDVIRSGLVDKKLIDFVANLDVIRHIDTATLGLNEGLRRFYRTIVWYRFNTVLKGDEFRWKGII
jgi:hypothetical protein